MRIKLLFLSLVMLSLSFADILAIGTKARQFTHQVKIAGNYMKRGDFSGCREKLNRAQGIYDKLDDEDKANKLVVKSKKLFDEMSSTLDKKGFPAKAISKLSKSKLKKPRLGSARKKFTKGKSFKAKGVSAGNAVPRKVRLSIDRFDKCLKNIERYYKEKWLSTAVKEVAKAEKVYAKIPSQYHGIGTLPANKKKFDDYSAKIGGMSKANNEARAAHQKSLDSRIAFNSDVSDLERFFMLLKEGKDKSFKGFVGNLTFMKGYASTAKKVDNFYATHKERLESGKAGTRTSFSAAEIIDFVKNKDKYKNAIIKIAIDATMESVIQSQKNFVSDLTNKGMCSNYVTKRLVNPDYKTSFEHVREIIKFCNDYNTPLPKKEMDIVDSYKPKILALIKSTAAKNSFNKSKYPTTDSYMKKAAIKTGNYTNLDLVYVGMQKGASWKIHKNALGIPLYKTAPGMALYHKKGDNFYRGRPATIKRVYNGSGYEPISSVGLKPKFYVYKK